MPEPYVPVLVHYLNGLMRVSYAVQINREWRWFPGDKQADYITHWMPLPKGPK